LPISVSIVSQHRLQADVARVRLDQRQQRRPLRLLILLVGVGVISRDGDQLLQPRGRRCRQPSGDPQRQDLFGLVQRRGNHPVDAAGGGRLDPLGVAVRQQLLPDPLRAPLGLGDVLGQPRGELVGIGDGALSKPKVLADLDSVALALAARPVVQAQLLGRDADLAGDVVDGVVGQLAAAAREPALPCQAFQQQTKAQPGRAAFVAQQLQLVIGQGEVLEQLLEVQRAGHVPPTGPAGQRRRRRRERTSGHRGATLPRNPPRCRVARSATRRALHGTW
jgi:hypothetical protein